jgi:hypothetical protein
MAEEVGELLGDYTPQQDDQVNVKEYDTLLDDQEHSQAVSALQLAQANTPSIEEMVAVQQAAQQAAQLQFVQQQQQQFQQVHQQQQELLQQQHQQQLLMSSQTQAVLQSP